MIIAYYIKLLLIAFVSVVFAVKPLLIMLLGNKNNFLISARQWSKYFLKISGVKLFVQGRENLSPQESYIYVSNHTNMFDIPILLWGLRFDDVRIVYKKELEKIPIFGLALKKSPFISIEREKPREAMQSINRAVELIRENISVIVFPEGTRSGTGNLGPFKRGAFMLASRSGKKIVPVTVKGSEKIKPPGKKQINSGNVVINLGPPIENSGGSSKEEKGLMDKTRQAILEALNSSI